MLGLGTFIALLVQSASPFQSLEKPIVLDGEPLEVLSFDTDAALGRSVFKPAPGLTPEGTFQTAWAVGDRYLWVGVRVTFAKPRPVLGPVGRRDAIPTGDEITLVIDPAGKGERAFRFTTNPAGVIQDAMMQAPESYEFAWDSLADVATRVFEDGWFAEFKIPLQELGIPSLDGTWGLNVLLSLWKEEQSVSLFPVDVGNRNEVAKVGYVDVSLPSVPEFSFRVLPAATVAGCGRNVF